MTNQILNSAKKRSERFVLDLVLTKIEETTKYNIKASEEPDFILTHRNGIIGVEIAKAYADNDNFITQRSKIIENRIIKILKRKGLFKELERNEKRSAERCNTFQILVPPFYLNEVEDDNLSRIPRLFEEWVNKGMSESQIFRVYENCSYKTKIEIIYCVGSVPVTINGKLMELCEEHPLHAIIKKKNDLLNGNFQVKNQNIKEWWLCLEVSEDSTLSACKYTVPSSYPNNYNRIFMVDSNRFRVYEFEIK